MFEVRPEQPQFRPSSRWRRLLGIVLMCAAVALAAAGASAWVCAQGNQPPPNLVPVDPPQPAWD
jgi:hypothetical protein